jgi:TP901 family phage tail tape measure protein
MIAVGATLSAALIKSANDVKQFNRAIEETAITANVSSRDIERMKESALALGNAIVPAEQVSMAYGMLMRNVRDVNVAMQLMPVFLDQAMVSGQSLTEVVALGTDVMSAFNLQAGEMNGVIDMATSIFSTSSWSIQETMNSLVALAPVATTAGLSVTQLGTLLGVMAAKGMSSEMAMSALQLVMGQLAGGSAEVRETLSSLGVQVTTSAGEMRPMMTILSELADQFATMPDGTNKTRIAVELFGTRAGARMGTLLSQGSVALKEYQEQIILSAGKTQKLADTASDSISPWNKFKNGIHEVSIKFGALTEPMSGVLSFATSLLVPLGSLAMIYPMLTAALHAHTFATVAHAVANKVGAVAQWLLNTAMYACPLVWIIALIMAVIAIIVLMVKHWDAIKEAVGKFAEGAKKKLGEFRDWVGSKFDAVKDTIHKGVEFWKDTIGKGWDKIKEGVGKAVDKTKEVVKFGVETMAKTLKGLSEMGEWFKEKGGEWGNKIKDGLGAAGEKIKSWWSDNAHKWFERYEKFKEVGEKLMLALKEGMEKAKKALQDAAGKIADGIKKFFGGSLPETGPLKNIEVMGEELMAGYVRGMARGQGISKNDLAAALGGISAGGVTRTYNNTYNFAGVGSALDANAIRDVKRRLDMLEAHKMRTTGGG